LGVTHKDKKKKKETHNKKKKETQSGKFLKLPEKRPRGHAITARTGSRGKTKKKDKPQEERT